MNLSKSNQRRRPKNLFGGSFDCGVIGKGLTATADRSEDNEQYGSGNEPAGLAEPSNYGWVIAQLAFLEQFYCFKNKKVTTAQFTVQYACDIIPRELGSARQSKQ